MSQYAVVGQSESDSSTGSPNPVDEDSLVILVPESPSHVRKCMGYTIDQLHVRSEEFNYPFK